MGLSQAFSSSRHVCLGTGTCLFLHNQFVWHPFSAHHLPDNELWFNRSGSGHVSLNVIILKATPRLCVRQHSDLWGQTRLWQMRKRSCCQVFLSPGPAACNNATQTLSLVHTIKHVVTTEILDSVHHLLTICHYTQLFLQRLEEVHKHVCACKCFAACLSRWVMHGHLDTYNAWAEDPGTRKKHLCTGCWFPVVFPHIAERRTTTEQ